MTVPPTILLWALGGSLVFYQLKTLDISVLMATMLISLWGVYVYNSGALNSMFRQTGAEDAATGARAAATSDSLPEVYHDKALPLTPVEAQQVPRKGLKYLSKNPHLLAILDDLRFTQMFDKGRFQHLRLLMNQYQKTYMYLLGRRYRIRVGVPILYDLQDGILEILYSLAVNVPVKLRHTYGLDPHARIHAQIDAFLGLTRTMTEILQNFSIIELKEPYFPEWMPRSFPIKDSGSTERKNVLP
jgi:hypothetical protein